MTQEANKPKTSTVLDVINSIIDGVKKPFSNAGIFLFCLVFVTYSTFANYNIFNLLHHEEILKFKDANLNTIQALMIFAKAYTLFVLIKIFRLKQILLRCPIISDIIFWFWVEARIVKKRTKDYLKKNAEPIVLITYYYDNFFQNNKNYIDGHPVLEKSRQSSVEYLLGDMEQFGALKVLSKVYNSAEVEVSMATLYQQSIHINHEQQQEKEGKNKIIDKNGLKVCNSKDCDICTKYVKTENIRRACYISVHPAAIRAVDIETKGFFLGHGHRLLKYVLYLVVILIAPNAR
jgi:hypothetical protein